MGKVDERGYSCPSLESGGPMDGPMDGRTIGRSVETRACSCGHVTMIRSRNVFNILPEDKGLPPASHIKHKSVITSRRIASHRVAR